MKLIRARYAQREQGDAEDIFDLYRDRLENAVKTNFDPERGLAIRDGKVQGYRDFETLTKTKYLRWAAMSFYRRHKSRGTIAALQGEDSTVLDRVVETDSAGQEDLTEQLADLRAAVPLLFDTFFASRKRSTPLRLQLGALLAGTSKDAEELLASPESRLELLKIVDPIRFARRLNPEPTNGQPFQSASDEVIRQWLSRGKQELANLYEIVIDDEEGRQ